jgi:serine/threonine-protein kinase
VALPFQELGPGPIQGLRLPRGSYRLRLRSAGCAEVLYPVALGRLERWELRRPSQAWVGEPGGAPLPVPLPAAGELGPEDCYVPPGWAWLGGDELAISSLPRQRRWVDGFIMRRFPVTNSEFIAFLDDLVRQGREAEALELCPRPALSGESQGTRPIYGRRPDGGFALVPDEDGDLWQPRWPVLLVNRRGAMGYARWLAERSGLPWRLPLEVEWEKATRGVDARSYAFGEHLDPSFCSMELSHPGKALPVTVDAFPLDESPYEIRGMAGNIRAWMLDRWRREGPLPSEVSPREAEEKAVSRGGGWLGDRRWTRAASRGWLLDHQRTWDLGFRVCRSWPPRAEEAVIH